jgi:hypothetical protein
MFEQPVGNLGRGIINLIKNESEMNQKANVANKGRCKDNLLGPKFADFWGK